MTMTKPSSPIVQGTLPLRVDLPLPTYVALVDLATESKTEAKLGPTEPPTKGSH